MTTLAIAQPGPTEWVILTLIVLVVVSALDRLKR